MNLSTTIARSFFCFILIVIILTLNVPFVSADATWYLPQRTEVYDVQKAEIGFRHDMINDESQGYDSSSYILTPFLRVSPFSRLSLYVEIPYYYHTEQEGSENLNYAKWSGSDIGDISVQAVYELIGREDWKLQFSLDSSLPTGRDPYDNKYSTGSGFTTVTGGFTVMKVLDPAIIYAYLGYQWSDDDYFSGIGGKVEPGGNIRYRLGMSLLLNPNLRASIYTSGENKDDMKFNGDDIDGSSANLTTLGTGLSWNLTNTSILTVNAAFGISDEATDSTISIGISKEFDFGKRKISKQNNTDSD